MVEHCLKQQQSSGQQYPFCVVPRGISHHLLFISASFIIISIVKATEIKDNCNCLMTELNWYSKSILLIAFRMISIFIDEMISDLLCNCLNIVRQKFCADICQYISILANASSFLNLVFSKDHADNRITATRINIMQR